MAPSSDVERSGVQRDTAEPLGAIQADYSSRMNLISSALSLSGSAAAVVATTATATKRADMQNSLLVIILEGGGTGSGFARNRQAP